MAEPRERELRFERRMSDAEALMWNVEKDPWLNPNGASIAVLDGPMDVELFRRRVRYAIAKIPRLRERVAPELGRLTPPMWIVDDEFDLDYHLRHVALPAPGSMRQLFDLCTRMYEDPFDRTRPLWLFVTIDGIEGGRSALLSKMHHTLSDGISALRLSEMYIDRERDAEPPPDVDLGQVITEALAVQAADTTDGVAPTTLTGAASSSVNHVMRRQVGVARRAAETMASWGTDPRKAMDAGQKAVEGVRSTLGQVRGGGGDSPGGSPLWTNRSRRRHLEFLRVPLDALKQAGQSMDASINDMFVAGAVEGALRYHEERGAPVDALNLSFVVSTRTDKAIGGNAFSPTRVQVPGSPMTAMERVLDVRDRLAERRTGAAGGGGIASLAGIANLLPTSVMTRVARSQVTKMDFATSNLRGARIPLYICGAEVLFNVTMGPVAGTAFNITTISYNGHLDIGMFIDPAAVEDPAELRRCLEDAFADLIAVGERRPSESAAGGSTRPAAKATRAATSTRPTRATKRVATRTSATTGRATKNAPAKSVAATSSGRGTNAGRAMNAGRPTNSGRATGSPRAPKTTRAATTRATKAPTRAAG
jgi:WS/DGAT/MGAT family acyltransferase